MLTLPPSKVTVKPNRSDMPFVVNAKPKCDDFV